MKSGPNKSPTCSAPNVCKLGLMSCFTFCTSKLKYSKLWFLWAILAYVMSFQLVQDDPKLSYDGGEIPKS